MTDANFVTDCWLGARVSAGDLNAVRKELAEAGFGFVRAENGWLWVNGWRGPKLIELIASRISQKYSVPVIAGWVFSSSYGAVLGTNADGRVSFRFAVNTESELEPDIERREGFEIDPRLDEIWLSSERRRAAAEELAEWSHECAPTSIDADELLRSMPGGSENEPDDDLDYEAERGELWVDAGDWGSGSWVYAQDGVRQIFHRLGFPDPRSLGRVEKIDSQNRWKNLLDAEKRQNIPFLISALYDPESFIRVRALKDLVKLNATEAIPEILPFLSAEDPHDRSNAATALGDLDAKEAIAPLEEIARNDSIDWVRSRAIEALAKINPQVAIEVCLEALDDESEKVRAGGAISIDRIASSIDAPSIPPIANRFARALGDSSPAVRRYAAVALFHFGDSRGLDYLNGSRQRWRPFTVPFWGLKSYQPMRPITVWLAIALAALWVAATAFIARETGGYARSFVVIAVALTFNELWLRLRVRKAWSEHVFYLPIEMEIGCGAFWMTLIGSIAIAIAVWVLWTRSYGFGLQLCVFLLALRLLTEYAERRNKTNVAAARREG